MLIELNKKEYAVLKKVLSEATEKNYVCEVTGDSIGWLRQDGTIAKVYGSAYKFLTVDEAKEFAVNYVRTNTTTVIIEEVKIRYYRPEFKRVMIISPTPNGKQVEVETIEGKVYESVNEAEEPAYMNGELNYWDRRRMSQGRPPIWAKSMKDIGPRKTNLRGSQTPSEIAMRSVNTPNGKETKPYMETDWKADKNSRKAANEKIAGELRNLLPEDAGFEFSADSEHANVSIGDYVFRVSSRGLRYFVLRFAASSIFDRKSTVCKTLDDVANFIKSNIKD